MYFLNILICLCVFACCVQSTTSVTSLQYIHYTKPQSWNTASRVCQSIGGRLVTVSSRRQVDILKKVLYDKKKGDIAYNVWIGLHRTPNTSLAWSDSQCSEHNTTVWSNFEYQIQNEYDEYQQCFRQVKDNLQWSKDSCKYHYQFICEKYVTSNECNYSDTNKRLSMVPVSSASTKSCKRQCDSTKDCVMFAPYCAEHCILALHSTTNSSTQLYNNDCSHGIVVSVDNSNTDSFKGVDDESHVPTSCIPKSTTLAAADSKERVVTNCSVINQPYLATVTVTDYVTPTTVTETDSIEPTALSTESQEPQDTTATVATCPPSTVTSIDLSSCSPSTVFSTVHMTQTPVNQTVYIRPTRVIQTVYMTPMSAFQTDSMTPTPVVKTVYLTSTSAIETVDFTPIPTINTECITQTPVIETIYITPSHKTVYLTTTAVVDTLCVMPTPVIETVYVTPTHIIETVYITPTPVIETVYVTPTPVIETVYITPTTYVEKNVLTPSPVVETIYITPTHVIETVTMTPIHVIKTSVITSLDESASGFESASTTSSNEKQNTFASDVVTSLDTSSNIQPMFSVVDVSTVKITSLPVTETNIATLTLDTISTSFGSETSITSMSSVNIGMSSNMSYLPAMFTSTVVSTVNGMSYSAFKTSIATRVLATSASMMDSDAEIMLMHSGNVTSSVESSYVSSDGSSYVLSNLMMFTSTTVGTVFAPSTVTETVMTTPLATFESLFSAAVTTSSVDDAPITSATSNVMCTKFNNTKISQKKLQDILDEIVAKLKVDTRKLSTTTRKKTSAPDPRPSSTTMGFTAGVIILVPFVLVIIGDIPRLFRDMVMKKLRKK